MAILKPFKQLSSGAWQINTKRRWNGFYIDPPYQFKNIKTGGGMKSGSSQKYITMPLKEICSLPISQVSEPNAILFCWVPSPLSDTYGHEIFEAWDFKFKGKLYWIKDKVDDSPQFNLNPKVKISTITKDGGWGYHFRGKVEELWFGFKGKIPMFANPLSNVIYHPRIGHSIKPDVFRIIVEDQFTKSFGKKRKMIEGFARRAPHLSRWSYFGDELR